MGESTGGLESSMRREERSPEGGSKDHFTHKKWANSTLCSFPKAATKLQLGAVSLLFPVPSLGEAGEQSGEGPRFGLDKAETAQASPHSSSVTSSQCWPSGNCLPLSLGFPICKMG